MSSIIKVETSETATIATLTLKKIYLGTSELFRDEIVKLLEGGCENLIIDLTEVSIMNSSAIGVLILARDKIEKRKGKIFVCGLQPLMVEIFKRMHLDLFFNLCDSPQKALEQI